MSDDLFLELNEHFGPGVEYVSSASEEPQSGSYTCKENTYLSENSQKSDSDSNLFNQLVSIVDSKTIDRTYSREEKTTHMIKVKRFLTGDVSVIGVTQLGDSQGKSRKRKSKDRTEMDPEKLMVSARRSKRTLIEKVLQINAQYLLTGTTRIPIYDRDLFDRHLAEFTKRIQKRLPKLKYCLVVERHKDKSFHWHMAAYAPNNFIPYAILHKTWRQVLTGNEYSHLYLPEETPGNVHSKKAAGKHRWMTNALAKYLGKYISKDIEVSDTRISKKRYWSTKGIPKPEVARLYINAKYNIDVEDLIDQVITELTGRMPANRFYISCSGLVGLYSATY